jgi:hypothetical protein
MACITLRSPDSPSEEPKQWDAIGCFFWCVLDLTLGLGRAV